MGEADRSHTASPVPVDVNGWKARPLPVAVDARNNIPGSRVQAWNTQNLGYRLGADFGAAACAGVLVAPVITIIDRGIIENASGRASLGASMKSSLRTLLLHPHHFLLSKPFALIFALYTGTYLTANTLDTTTATIRNAPAGSSTSGPAKFLATSSANLSLCLYKDSRFTQLFGAATRPRPVPGPTYALFALRDCLTVFASFNVPPVLAPRLRLDAVPKLEQHVSRASAAQFLAPAAVQLVSTPLHLLGLDLYNRERAGWRERARLVAGKWAMSCLARMGRIVPAFGVGGVVNMRVRRGLMGRLE